MGTLNADQQLVVGLVQVGEMSWQRRSQQSWHMEKGIPVPNPSYTNPRSFVYLPYSIGLLQAYVQKYANPKDRYRFLLPICKPTPTQEAAEYLSAADVVGFSAYIWNVQQSLAIAKRLKEIRPDVVIVFGGPQVPDRVTDFLKANPFIDVVVHGPGEEIFFQLLQRLPDRNWQDLASTSYLDENGTCITNLTAPRIRDLSVLPSPYLEGTFNPLIEANDHEWLVIWETNRGCPFSCTFCDWGSAVASKVFQFDMDRLMSEIKWFSDHKIRHMFICDANFGIFSRDVEIAENLYGAYKSYGYPSFISVQSSKNATERTYQIQKILSRMTSSGATLSLQSTNADTLKNIKRDNISLKSYNELQHRYRRDGIATYTDLLLGLPGDDYDAFANGVNTVISNGQHNHIAFYNSAILPNAEMGNPDYIKKFGLVTVPVAIIHHHDNISEIEKREVLEYIETVVGTNSMPKEEWLKTRTFAWMTNFLYFQRLMQVVFVLLVEQYGLTYRQLIEVFTNADPERYPTLDKIYNFLMARAKANQAGESEYQKAPQWLNLYWPIYQYSFIWLVREGQHHRFYEESEAILAEFLQQSGIDYDAQLLHETIQFNESMISVPFKVTDLRLKLSYNIYEYYLSAQSGERVPLEKRPSSYDIIRTRTLWLTWESWYEDVVIRINAKRNYLYPIKPVVEEQEKTTTAYQVAATGQPTSAISTPGV